MKYTMPIATRMSPINTSKVTMALRPAATMNPSREQGEYR
jgi:hypothetical protein